MAVQAEAFLIHRLDAFYILAPVGFVTIAAEHLPLRHGVPRGEGESGLYILMAPKTQRIDLISLYLLPGTLVQLVTVGAGDFAPGVMAEGPVLHVGHGVGAVALETEHGTGRCGQRLEGNELGIIAPVVLFDKIRFQGLAAGAVAGLTVDEGHFGPLDPLLAVNTARQELSCLIVIVAGLETGLVTHIISEKRPD